MPDDRASSTPTEKTADARRPTRPRGYPLVGQLPAMLSNGPELFRRLTIEHPGEVVEVDLGVTSLYLATHPDHVHHVMVEGWHTYTKNSPTWRPIKRLLGNGIFTATGETWERNRRLVQPIFSPKSIMGLAEPMIEVVTTEVDELVAEIERGRHGVGDRFDMSDFMMRLTQRIILATMFGTSLPRERSDELGKLMRDGFAAMNARLFLPFVPDRLMPGERAFRAASAALDETILGIVGQRRASGESRNDFLSLLLAARDEQGSGMSDRQLRDELVTMFVAGNETLALTMSWTFALLDLHPEVDRRVHAELLDVLGHERPTAERLQSLDYCRRVGRETLRLYPPSWFIPRLAERADTIGGFAIPAGATVAVSQYALQRDPAFWQDPERFDPDRFLPERSEGRPRCSYIPFGVGPRQCIGIQFALLEALVILSIFRRRVRARLAPGHVVSAEPAVTLRPKGGMPMKLDLEP